MAGRPELPSGVGRGRSAGRRDRATDGGRPRPDPTAGAGPAAPLPARRPRLLRAERTHGDVQTHLQTAARTARRVHDQVSTAAEMARRGDRDKLMTGELGAVGQWCYLHDRLCFMGARTCRQPPKPFRLSAYKCALWVVLRTVMKICDVP